ncbi:hypothetical protein [Actinocorallia lasiicapitis]
MTLEDGRWRARTPDVGGAISAPTLARMKTAVEESTAFLYGDEPYEIVYVFDLPVEVSPSLAAYHATRVAAAERLAEAQRLARRVAAELTAAKITERDAAEVMGLSKQRIHQLKSAG